MLLLFPEFVMGSPHLTSEEVMNYSNVEDDSLPGDYGDHGANEAAMTDDESSSDEEMAERLRRLKDQWSSENIQVKSCETTTYPVDVVLPTSPTHETDDQNTFVPKGVIHAYEFSHDKKGQE